MSKITKEQIEELYYAVSTWENNDGDKKLILQAADELTRLCAIEEAVELWLAQMIELGCIGPDDGGVVPILRKILKGKKPKCST